VTRAFAGLDRIGGNALTLGLLLMLWGAAGTLIVGHVRDLTDHFRLSFVLLAAVAVVMLSVTPFLHRREQA
jgi:cyanate permease